MGRHRFPRTSRLLHSTTLPDRMWLAAIAATLRRVKLSRRSDWPDALTPWATAVQAAKDRGPLLDLRNSNPTAVELLHPDTVYRHLGNAQAARYQPQAQGLAVAREAIAGNYYGPRGRSVDPADIWLHASTSEAYVQWFTVLGDPGDVVLVPQPGYPLFDMLASLAGLRTVGYPLDFDGGWHLDRARLDAIAGAESRLCAIVVVAPSNPTGHVPTAAQWSALQSLAADRDVALVVDEVFADYPSAPGLDPFCGLPMGEDHACLVLSGLSKVAALPQMKLSWTAMHGPASARRALGRRVEHVADATLGVGGPVQHAVPQLLDAAETLQPQIRARIWGNLTTLRSMADGQAFDVLPLDGGWTALLRLPRLDDRDDEWWARRLLEAGVWVQPGFLFDIPAPPRLAISLLTPPTTLLAAMVRLRAVVAAAAG